MEIFGAASASKENGGVGVGVNVPVGDMVGVSVLRIPPCMAFPPPPEGQFPMLVHRVGVFGGIQEEFEVCAVTHW